MARAAAIVFADTGAAESLGRVVNALTTAKEFDEAGDEAVVIFDGAGTKWLTELSRPDHDYHALFEDARELITGACSYCAAAFGCASRSSSSRYRCWTSTPATRAFGGWYTTGTQCSRSRACPRRPFCGGSVG